MTTKRSIPSNGILKETTLEQLDPIRKKFSNQIPIFINMVCDVSYMFLKKFKELNTSK